MSQRQAPLADEVLENLRNRLTARSVELQTHLRHQIAEMEQMRNTNRLTEVQDTKDASFLAALAEVRLAGADQDVTELRDIEAAVARIDGGVYGVCSDCGDDIPDSRLQIHPTAKRCRPCQEAKELRRAY